MLRTIGFIAIGAFILIFGAAAWVKTSFSTDTYRYRLTVAIDVGGQLLTGASVIGVNLTKQPRVLPEVLPVISRAHGDAVFVDLGGGRHVIALLVSGPTGGFTDYPQSLVPTHFNLSYDDKDLPKYSLLEGSWDLSEKYLPTFVTFSNLNDPKTARVVKPEEFGQVFGSGTRLRKVTVEMTKDPVTRGLEKKLPWLSRMISDGLGGVINSSPGRFIVNAPYFVRS